MRHKIAGRKLNRTSAHRKALFNNMIASLIEHEHIKTTLPKAKEIRPLVEKMVTLGKNKTLHSRRQILSVVKCTTLAQKLIDVLGVRYEKRAGGYTRIIRAGYRYGDAAPMAIIEFVDRQASAVSVEDSTPNKKKAPKKKSTTTTAATA